MSDRPLPSAAWHVPVLVVAVSLWLLAALFVASALFLLLEADGSIGLALLSGYSATVAFGGGWVCFGESRAAGSSFLRAIGTVLLVVFGILAGLALGSLVRRSDAHGAFEGLAVLFGGAAVSALVCGAVCFLYAAPRALHSEQS
jgi:hypothetical protein